MPNGHDLEWLLKQENSEQLKRLDRLLSVGLLSAGIFHDLRTVLNGISTFASLLKASMTCKKGSNSASDLENIILATARGKQMCERMLEYAKAEKVSSPAIMSASQAFIPIHEVIQSTVDWLSASKMLQQAKIRLQLNEEPVLAGITADAFQQILVNLLINAVQATQGTGDILISTEIKTIKKKKYAFCHVSDNGVGISSENLDHLFSPLFTTKSEGTGLGLYITKQITEQYNGEISVESQLDKGTTFSVRFPLEWTKLKMV